MLDTGVILFSINFFCGRDCHQLVTCWGTRQPELLVVVGNRPCHPPCTILHNRFQLIAAITDGCSWISLFINVVQNVEFHDTQENHGNLHGSNRFRKFTTLENENSFRTLHHVASHSQTRRSSRGLRSPGYLAI